MKVLEVAKYYPSPYPKYYSKQHKREINTYLMQQNIIFMFAYTNFYLGRHVAKYALC